MRSVAKEGKTPKGANSMLTNYATIDPLGVLSPTSKTPGGISRNQLRKHSTSKHVAKISLGKKSTTVPDSRDEFREIEINEQMVKAELSELSSKLKIL